MKSANLGYSSNNYVRERQKISRTEDFVFSVRPCFLYPSWQAERNYFAEREKFNTQTIVRTLWNEVSDKGGTENVVKDFQGKKNG